MGLLLDARVVDVRGTDEECCAGSKRSRCAWLLAGGALAGRQRGDAGRSVASKQPGERFCELELAVLRGEEAEGRPDAAGGNSW